MLPCRRHPQGNVSSAQLIQFWMGLIKVKHWGERVVGQCGTSREEVLEVDDGVTDACAWCQRRKQLLLLIPSPHESQGPPRWKAAWQKKHLRVPVFCWKTALEEVNFLKKEKIYILKIFDFFMCCTALHMNPVLRVRWETQLSKNGWIMSEEYIYFIYLSSVC